MHSHWRDNQEWKNYGLPLSTTSNEASKYFDAVVTQYTGLYEDTTIGGIDGCIDKMLAADPNFVMGHVIKNGLNLMGTHRNIRLDSEFRQDLETLNQLSGKKTVSSWERKHVNALNLWAKDWQYSVPIGGVFGLYDPEYSHFSQLNAACSKWEEILMQKPQDIIALKFVQDSHFYLGQAFQLRDSVARVLPYWNSDMPLYGYLLGMYAFGLEESNLYEKAEINAKKALELNRHDAWAVHAICHVNEMLGRQDEGDAFLQKTENNWKVCGLLACHNYWHWALYHIERGKYENALSIFDNECGPRVKSCSLLDVVDATSLLYRLQMEGVDIKDRWNDIFEVCRPFIDDHVLTFNDVHILLCYLGAGQKDTTHKFMESLKNFIQNYKGEMRDIAKDVGMPMCEAFIAYDDGDYGRAVDLLTPIRYKIVKIGGSNAQRDLFNLFLIHAALKSPTTEHHRLARQLLYERKSIKQHAPMTDRLMAQAILLHGDST